MENLTKFAILHYVRAFFVAAVLVFGLSTQAQNIQLHYDFGRNLYPNEEDGRQKVTLTLEQFKADPWGSWFYFVDIDFSRKNVEGAYTEISREFNLGKTSPFAAHIEYDGGLDHGSGSFQHAALVGGAWNGHTADFSKTYSVQLMYKRFFRGGEHSRGYHSFQLTGVWGLNFFNEKFTFSGFIDLWRGENADGHGKLIMISEPQFWYNVTPHLSLGGEIEISNNFIFNTYSDKTFFMNPTVAAKWNF